MIKVSFDKLCGKWSIDRKNYNFGYAASLQAAVCIAMDIALMNPIESLKVQLPSFPMSKTTRMSLPLREFRSWQDDINRYEDEIGRILAAEQVAKVNENESSNS